MKQTTPSIGTIIREFRKSKGITQFELADGICSKDYIYAIEKGKYDPSPYILERLSSKLGVDLLDYRNELIKHNSIETHNMYLQLNNYLYTDSTQELINFIPICENNPDFDSGDLYIFLLYCKACIAFDNSDFDTCLDYCQQGLNTLGLDLFNTENILFNLSNEAVLIIRLYAIALHSLNRITEAKKIYLLIYKHYKFVLNRPIYELNKTIHFQVVTFLIISYNLALIYTDEQNYKKAEPIIIKSLELIKKTKSVHMMIPHLLCYVEICYHTDRLTKAQEMFDDIPIILKYCGEKEHYEDFLTQYEQYLPLLKLNK